MDAHFRGPLPVGAGIVHVLTPVGKVTLESDQLSAFEAQAGHFIAAYLIQQGRKYVMLSTGDVLCALVFPGNVDRDRPANVIPFRAVQR